jgi:hypothetical protein
VLLYELLDLSAPQATSANLNGARSSVDQSLDRYEIGAEYALRGYADVLTDTTMLLGLTFSRNTVPGYRSFSANLTRAIAISTLSNNSLVGRTEAC